MRFSPSQIATFYKCGEQWRRRYIEREIIPPGIAAHTGQGVHRSAESNHRQKIATKRDLTSADIVERAVEGYSASLNESGVRLGKDEKSKGKKAVLGEGKDKTARLAQGYAELVAPRIQPIMVEQSITIDVTDDLALGNIIDVVAEGDNIIDLKTGAKKWAQGRVDDSIQLTSNAMTYEALTGRRPSKLTIETLGAGKTITHATLTTQRVVSDFDALIRRMIEMDKSIKAGIFIPANPDEWYCSARWCGYYDTCPYR